MQSVSGDHLNMLEKARRKVNLATMALNKAIDDGEGTVDFDNAEGILLTIREAGQLLEKLGVEFSEAV